MPDQERIVLVQDSTIERIGRVEVAREVASPSVTGITWAEAIGYAATVADGARWFLAVEEDPDSWDRIHAIDAIPLVRVAAGLANHQVTAIVDDPDNPLLRLRLLRAGVTKMMASSQLRRTETWLAALEGTLAPCTVEVSDLDRAMLSIGRSSDPSAAIRWISEAGCEEAFAGSGRQEETGLSRRAILRIRTEVSLRGDLRPARRRTGGSMRPSTAARWRDVVAFVNLTRSATTDDASDLPDCCASI